MGREDVSEGWVGTENLQHSRADWMGEEIRTKKENIGLWLFTTIYYQNPTPLLICGILFCGCFRVSSLRCLPFVVNKDELSLLSPAMKWSASVRLFVRSLAELREDFRETSRIMDLCCMKSPFYIWRWSYSQRPYSSHRPSAVWRRHLANVDEN